MKAARLKLAPGVCTYLSLLDGFSCNSFDEDFDLFITQLSSVSLLPNHIGDGQHNACTTETKEL